MTYCLSYTEMLLIGRPFASRIIAVAVIVLLSGDTTKVVVPTSLPALVSVSELLESIESFVFSGTAI